VWHLNGQYISTDLDSEPELKGLMPFGHSDQTNQFSSLLKAVANLSGIQIV
jgi:hypothetical protein